MSLILSVALVLAVLVDATVGTVRTRRALAAVDAVPANRSRFYRRFIVIGWVRAVLATLVVFSAGLSLTDIGLAGPGSGPTAGVPDGGTLGWLAAATLILSTGIGAVRARRSMRAGQIHPQRVKIAALVPRTTGERWHAAALSITAGVTEEILFRGALIALGITVFHLPMPVAAALSLVLFAAMHAYQGRLGVLNSGFVGLLFTILTLLSGSLVPAIAMHIAVDLFALLVVPAEATPRPPDIPEQPAVVPADVPPPTEKDQQTAPTLRPPAPAG
ncbi:CPBP family intramembrane glutamic endopeptidase [Actinoplanes palleronii]|uniref:CAAX prenyl protease 2/Lysostaphin resistance protein A-like domain-containing protein n=1 Tax=Actinoplanes palleronii TaxID=113570 RepID=A0ABQ4BNZ0_9ACTN|nr:CPBP family intramembrane glutamic endopeptidase [Actinoplanes palleronii]GIE72379.1 hypothetical protein Apa02nite_084870 [Actinoplanes palleronii]